MNYHSRNENGWTLLAMVLVAIVFVVIAYYVLIGILGLTFYALGVAFYFVPSLVAMYRRHRSVVAIFIFNLLLGWTFIAWAIALAWAFTNPD